MEHATSPVQAKLLSSCGALPTRRLKLTRRPVLRPPMGSMSGVGLSPRESYLSTSRLKTVKVQLGRPEMQLSCSARPDTSMPLCWQSNLKLGAQLSSLPKALISTGGLLSCRRLGTLKKPEATEDFRTYRSDWLVLMSSKEPEQLEPLDRQHIAQRLPEVDGGPNGYISARIRPISHVHTNPLFKKIISQHQAVHKESQAKTPAGNAATLNTPLKVECEEFEAGQEMNAKCPKVILQRRRKHKIRVDAKPMCAAIANVRLATAHAGRRPDSRYSQKSLGCSLEVYSPRTIPHEYEVPIKSMNYAQSKAQHIVVPSCWE
jgi:hypothetical protein